MDGWKDKHYNLLSCVLAAKRKYIYFGELLLFDQVSVDPNTSYITIVRQEHKLAYNIFIAFAAKKPRVWMSWKWFFINVAISYMISVLTVHVNPDDVCYHPRLERPQWVSHVEERGPTSCGEVDNIREAEWRILRTVRSKTVGCSHSSPHRIEDSWGKASWDICS